MQLYLHQDASWLTSLHVGGKLWGLCIVEPRADDCLDVAELARRANTPLIILGGGTNLLVSDDGWNGIVLKLTNPNLLGITTQTAMGTEGGTLTAVAGLQWNELVAWSVERGWQGLECMTGIPGTVGGAIAGGIGAYDQQVADVVTSVEAVDLKTRDLIYFSKERCHFGYRTSIFNRPENLDRYVILGAELKLKPGGAPCRTHLQVASHPAPKSSLGDVSRIVRQLRQAKGMLYGLHQSAGSFFKNPTLPDGTSLSAAKLIEEAGYHQGYVAKNGRVGLSFQHVLALVNLAKANADDIVTLAREIQQKVATRSGIILEPEVRLVGFKEYPLMRP